MVCKKKLATFIHIIGNSKISDALMITQMHVLSTDDAQG